MRARDDRTITVSAAGLFPGRRRSLARAAACLGASGLALLGACSRERPAERAPVELVGSWSSFPLAASALPPAVPLGPLLAADEPDRLAVSEPAEGALNLRRGDPLQVRFNRPMVAEARPDRPASVLRFQPEVPGKQRWIRRNVLSFEPSDEVWGRGAAVSMRLDPALRSLAGEAAPELPPWTVIFDASPRLARGPRGPRVLAGEPVEVLFDGKVDLPELSSQMLMYEVDGGRRRIPFALSSKTRDARGRTPVEIKPELKLEPGAKMAVAVAPRLSRGGSSPRVLEVEVAPRPRVEGIACPDDADEASDCAFQGPPGRVVDVDEALILLSSAPLAPVQPSSVEVTPAVDNLKVKVEGDQRLVIRADWDPGQVYQVGLRSLADREGHALARFAPLAVRSKGRAPEVRFRDGRWVYERDDRPVLQLSAVHADRGEVRLAPVPAGSEIAAALSPASLLPAAKPDQWRRLPLQPLVPSARPNRWGQGSLDWREASASGSSMAVLQILAAPPAEPEAEAEPPAKGAAPKPGGPPAAFVQWTDLGLDARVLPAGVQAWVTSLASARPVVGARVTVGDAEGKELSANTDLDGVAWIDWPQGEKAAELAVRAVAGDDRAVVLVDPRSAMGPRHLGLVPGEPRPAVDLPSASLFADRGVYRAGEVVRARAIARCGPAGARKPCDGALTFKLLGPDREAPEASFEATADAFGAASADLALGDRAAPGSYRLELWRDGEKAPLEALTLAVNDYHPPALRVDLSSDEAPLCAGDAVQTRVEARYPFGSPAAGATASWSWERTALRSRPEGWDGYVFRAVDASSSGATLDSGQVTLDAQGRGAIGTKAVLGAAAREGGMLHVNVRDPSGRTTSARRSFTFYPAEHEVGVRELPAWIDHGTPLDVDAIVVDHDGKPAEGDEVEVRILREGWHGWWQWARGARSHDSDDDEGESEGTYQPRRTRERKVAHTCKLTSGREPSRCSWSPDRPGTYVLEASTRDRKKRPSVASVRVYVAGADEHPDRDAPGSAVTLTASHADLKVGGVGEVAFESPFPEAEALFQVQRDRVLFSERRRVKAGGQVFSFTVSEAMLPGAFASVTLVRPRTGPPGAKLDLDAPDLRVGMTALRVRPSPPPLSVRIALPGPAEAEKAEAPAGSEVPIEVTVTDAEGKPAQAEVTLYAVDEGTLRLTGYSTPDPGAGLFAEPLPWFAWEDLRRSLSPRLSLTPGPGGDGGADVARALAEDRERFDPTPLWAPALRTDEQGVARARLALPRRPADYRVLAVAVDRGTRSGASQRGLIASRSLVLRPSLPRFVVQGDRFEAAAFVHSTRGEPADVEVKVKVNGAEQEPASLHFEKPSEQRVGRWIEAVGDEDLEITFEASTKGESDAVKHTVHVAPRARVERAEAVGSAQGRRELTVAFPGASPLYAADLTLAVASHPFVGFDMEVAALQASPFAWAEPTASTLIGLAAYSALGVGRRPSGASAGELAARAERAVARLLSLQTPSGGFARYDRDGQPEPYLSAYALHALTTAYEAGFKVPEGARRKAVEWLQERSRDGSVLDADSEQGRDTLALVLRALAGADAAEVERTKALYDQRERLSPYGLAQLALAMPDGDRRREELIVELLRRVLATRDDEARDRSVLRWYDSSARTLGAALEASSTMPSGAASSAKLASMLLRLRAEPADGGGFSPHEASHALAGLAAYARRFTPPGCMRARVWLDGREVSPAEHDTDTSWFVVRAHDEGAPHRLVIEAPDPTYFALSSRWMVPLGEADQVARGGRVALHRRLETEAGVPLDEGAHVRLGDLIRVRLFAYSEAGGPSGVLLRGRNAGGFEVLDASADTTPRDSLRALLGMEPDDEVTDARGHYAQRSLDSIASRGFTEREALFAVGDWPHGLQEYTYGVRATAPGTFLFPPAEIEAQHAPGFVARSATFSITVDP